MRMIQDKTGRFRQRPHYQPSELDRECESIVTKFLQTRYGAARFPISTDDLSLMIEKETEDLDHYADLNEYGPGVEGLTMFEPGARPIVKIANFLADGNRENRRRTTLTHEFGHVVFHAHLFDSQGQTDDLFGQKDAAASELERVQVCKRDTMVDAAPVDWMEWQAGHVCGAILMPATAVRAVIRDKFSLEIAGGRTKDGKVVRAMIEELQARFQVSEQAARVRLLRLGILHDVANAQQLI